VGAYVVQRDFANALDKQQRHEAFDFVGSGATVGSGFGGGGAEDAGGGEGARAGGGTGARAGD
jgi:hypothetical protein